MMNWKSVLRTILCVLLLATVLATLGACSSAPAGEEQSESNTIFAVEYHDAVIELGTDADPVLKKLGEPKDKQFVASCGDNVGDQWKYDFGSVFVYTVKGEKSETVDAIVLRDDSAETVSGISIGSTVAEMTEKYGEAKVDGTKRRYQKDGKTLEFLLDENEKIIGAELRVES